jgi:trehalose 6-phosphate phosphatase
MAEPLAGIEQLLPLLDGRSLGFFSDIDGTLAPIVPRSEDAHITAKCRELLTALIESGARVALITGRTMEDARGTADIEGVAFGANHGLELWIDGRIETHPEVALYVEAVRRVLEETRDLGIGGLIVENKGPIIAFHYRNAGDQPAARVAILEALQRSRSARKFDVQEGRKVVELRPRLKVNKGTALTELAARLEVAAVVCIGDDRTDIDMFRAAAELRSRGAVVATVAVRNEEAAPEVLAAADYWVDGVKGVESLLESVLRAIRSRSP